MHKIYKFASVLCNYILDTEREDYVECLRNEPYYLENEIITEEEVHKLEFDKHSDESEAIIDRTTKHPSNPHIYSTACLLWEEIECKTKQPETDWKLLREQKEHLLEVITSTVPDTSNSFGLLHVSMNKQQHLALQGILHLIDSIQDDAVDSQGLSEEEVFGLTKENEK